MGGLLHDTVSAHGGSKAWDQFSRIRARILINGKISDKNGGLAPFADGTYEMLTREESVAIIPRSRGDQRSSFRRNVLTLESPQDDLVETQYNPRPSFGQLEPFGILDAFQRAYICSYSVWASLTQPFLFTYPGFETEELSPVSDGKEELRRLKVTFPIHISSHSRQMICYIAANGLMRRQDLRFEVLGEMAVTSYLSGYAEIQGLKIPLLRQMYAAQDTDIALAPVLAAINVLDVNFS